MVTLFLLSSDGIILSTTFSAFINTLSDVLELLFWNSTHSYAPRSACLSRAGNYAPLYVTHSSHQLNTHQLNTHHPHHFCINSIKGTRTFAPNNCTHPGYKTGTSLLLTPIQKERNQADEQHRKIIMSRKGVGLAAFDRSRLTSAQYASHGSSLRTSNAAALETQLAVFRSLLQQFAQTHARDIRSNPTFRAQFARMCAAIGVDPLASSSSSSGGSGAGSSSIWAQLLGRSVNDFYFELAVRVVEVCGETRNENGGLIELSKVRERIMKARMEGSPEITE